LCIIGKKGGEKVDKKLPIKLEGDQLDKVLKDGSVASKIKFLSGEGMARADISRTLTAVLGRQISYQWVKNVLDKA
jgi:hypothetical protein